MKKAFNVCVLLLSVFSVSALKGAEQSPALFENYDAMRQFLIKELNSAKKRIWVATDYFTDNEIATALFVAKYRNIDVNILIGGTKANAHMSRVRFFKNNNVPVFQIPNNFVQETPTSVFIDDQLLNIDIPLNFMEVAGRVNIFYGTNPKKSQYDAAFAQALKKNIDPYYKPSNLPSSQNIHVSNRKQKYYLPPPDQSPFQQSSLYKGRSIYKTDLDEDTFIYSLQKEERPAYIPSQLPEKTLSGETAVKKRARVKKKK